MDVRLIDLPWLVSPPVDFRQQLRSLSKATETSRATTQRLVASRLSVNQLHALGSVVSTLARSDSNAIRLGVLSNSTTELLSPAIAVSALRHGVWVDVITTPFDQVAMQALDPASEIKQAHCHYVLLCLDHRGLPMMPNPGDPVRAQAALESAVQYFESIRNGLTMHSKCTLIVQTIPPVASRLFGSLERNVPGTLSWLIDHYNAELRVRLRNSADLLLDIASLAETVGIAQWHDPGQWNLGKFPFSHEVVPIYAEWVGRLIGAARGNARKCLVLDLDNTLWGGVIGDDGLAGIILGNGSPTGEAYLDVQRTALALRDRGILLAVSSKNDDTVARNAFRSHPEMLLKEEHISIFQANWQDKATNLATIAEAMNIGIDSLVLLDDNPAERAQVRDALPNVAVPELPPDPAFYSETLLAAGYFEALQFTSEDKSRADQYKANAARAVLLDSTSDLNSYLCSLRMRATLGPFDPAGRIRITQLINKTNQFNLTTRRYTESEVHAFETAASGLTLQIRLLDRFGDNGMIAVVICVQDGHKWVIDTWLMSCRVLNRRVEEATLNYIVTSAKAAGVDTIIGNYLRTARNGLVKDLYERLGFAPSYVTEDESRWALDVASYVPAVVPMEIDVVEVTHWES